MNIKKEILEIPHALQEMFEKGRPQYDVLVRRVNWNERPVFMVGDNSSYMAAMGGAWAFESLLGVPVVVRRPAVFSAYTSRALAVRSLVIVVSGSDESEETLQAAKMAKKHGAVVWAVSAKPDGELTKVSDAVVNYYAGESPAEGVLSIFCRHAVMLFLAISASRILRSPFLRHNEQEEELGRLPKQIEWVLEQISDAARVLATEMSSRRTFVVGGGPFHPVALQSAFQLQKLAQVDAHGCELLEFDRSSCHIPHSGEGILYLSSSRCGLKAQVHESARGLRQKGSPRVFAITDGNDRQLSERATLAVLLPVLTEAGGALLTLAFLHLVTHYATQTPRDSSS